MKNYLFIFSCVFIFSLKFSGAVMHAQNNSEATIGLEQPSVLVGSSFCWYKNNLNISDFNTFDLFLGSTFDITILDNLLIKSQPKIGIKLKKEYDYRFDLIGSNQNYDPNDYPFYTISEIDNIDKILNRNHYFIEFPLLIGYKIKSKISIASGYAIRYYLPSRDNDIITHMNFLVSNFEHIWISNISFDISNLLLLNLGYSMGIGNIYDTHIITRQDNETIEFNSKLSARYINLSIDFRF